MSGAIQLLSQLPVFVQYLIVVLGGLASICFMLQAIPGRVGHFFGIATIDIRKAIAWAKGLPFMPLDGKDAPSSKDGSPPAA